MSEKLTLTTQVEYGAVDRRERMLLMRIFKLLQDAAIAQANRFGTGSEAAATRGETWVLNRIAAEIERYPRVGESLRVETWSNGIRGFKGLRDFRVYDASGRPIVAATSLWLYVSVAKKSIVRVPAEIAAGFPVGTEGMRFPEIETFEPEAVAENASETQVSLRFSDFDANEHVNNAAYLDLVQTALDRAGQPSYPGRVRMKYSKAIPTGTEAVRVRVMPRGDGASFRVDGEGVVFAQGDVARDARD